MIKTIIIDDEQHCINAILHHIKGYENMFNVLGTYKTVEEGLEATKLLKPELVFLDIKIKNQTGFDFLKQLKKIDFNIIFTTAYESYAIKAFKFSALDYLLKPIDANDFHLAILKLKEKLLLTDLKKKIEVLLYNLKVDDSLKRISIASSDGYTFIEVADILYCKADINYTHIYTKQGEKITTSKTLKIFENLLSKNSFYRIHNSYLINLLHIKKYTKGKGGYVTMKNNKNIEVSIRRKEDFLKYMVNLK